MNDVKHLFVVEPKYILMLSAVSRLSVTGTLFMRNSLGRAVLLFILPIACFNID